MDENLTWRDHIHTVENKMELKYQGKHYLDENSLKQIYFAYIKEVAGSNLLAYIHAYLNYANMVWASTHKTKLKKVQNKQKHALRIYSYVYMNFFFSA